MSPRTAQMNLTLREDKRASGEFFKLFLTSMSRISVFDDFWIKATGLAQFHIHTTTKDHESLADKRFHLQIANLISNHSSGSLSLVDK
jgi:hypothetical protein